MFQFLFRRTLGAVVILIIISAMTYFLFFTIPQDPALMSCGKNCTPDVIKSIHHTLGLDKPIPVQYWDYMVGIFRGRHFDAGNCPAPCFGYSFVNSDPVWQTMTSRLPVTISLAIGGTVVFLIVGVGAGMIAAARKGSLLDKVVSSGSLVLSSLQIYFVGPLVLAALVYNNPIMSQPNYVSFFDNPLSWLNGLIIPFCVLSIIFTANYSRMARSSMIEQLQEEHVRTARAKGLSSRTVFFRYAWRGSLIPIITILGIDMGALLGGAMITEKTFGLAGLGMLAVQSVVTTDLPMLMGVMLFSAFMIVAFNIVVDAAYAFIDPRVRLS
ncbi:ABC transporter permease [Streptomyces sp. NPDC059373]